MVCVLIHGVPDTPILWDALIKQLGLGKDQALAPALPGFTAPHPPDFKPSKESYLDWLINLLEVEYAASGPIDLVGHDWGAILCIRAAHSRPDLIKSWTAMNAVILPGADWHKVARLWQKPVVGKLLMACARPWIVRRMLPKVGLPADMVNRDPHRFNRHMKRSILGLYGSAIDVDNEWGHDLSNLPNCGLVIWGGRDRFMSATKAKGFSKAWDVPLNINPDQGHWAPYEDSQAVANQLRQHWDKA